MVNKIGVSVAQGLDVPIFFKDVPNFVKDIPKFVNDIPRLPKSISRGETTSNHFPRVSKKRNGP